MQDTKRGTGRTTRMILKAVGYVLQNPNHGATIVVHDSNAIAFVTQYMLNVFQCSIVDKVRIITYKKWQDSGIGRKPDIFFDHHCFYMGLSDLYKERDQLANRIALKEHYFGEYDA